MLIKIDSSYDALQLVNINYIDGKGSTTIKGRIVIKINYLSPGVCENEIEWT